MSLANALFSNRYPLLLLSLGCRAMPNRKMGKGYRVPVFFSTSISIELDWWLTERVVCAWVHSKGYVQRQPQCADAVSDKAACMGIDVLWHALLCASCRSSFCLKHLKIESSAPTFRSESHLESLVIPTWGSEPHFFCLYMKVPSHRFHGFWKHSLRQSISLRVDPVAVFSKFVEQ